MSYPGILIVKGLTEKQNTLIIRNNGGFGNPPPVASLIREQEQRHDADPQEHRHELRERLAHGRGLVKFRNQVGPSDVEETPGAESDHHAEKTVIHRANRQRDDSSENRGQGREEVDQKRLRLRKSRVQQYAEIADLLRDLVQDDGDRRRDADLDADEIARADDHAVDEIVHAVRCDDQVPHRLDMLMKRIRPLAQVRLGGGVGVVPVQEFLEREKCHDAEERQERRDRRLTEHLETLRQKMDERIAEQRPRGQAHQEKQDAVQQFFLERKHERSDQRHRAHEQDAE